MSEASRGRTMNRTNIAYCDFTVNPIRARRIDGLNRVAGHFCQKVSSGCANCYASTMQARFGLPDFPGIATSPADNDLRVYLDDDVLRDVRRREKGGIVFWCSMSDLFGWWVTPEWRSGCCSAMLMQPYMTHLLLTKRGQMMSEWFAKSPVPPNVWLGVTAESADRFEERVPILQEVGLPRLWVSCEPLLDDLHIDAAELEGIGQVIVGSETGPGARPCNPEWVRSIVDVCAEAGVPCFVKQIDRKGTAPGPEWPRQLAWR